MKLITFTTPTPGAISRVCGVLRPGADERLYVEVATAVAKVGFFLKQHRDALMVDESSTAQACSHAALLSGTQSPSGRQASSSLESCHAAGHP